MQINRLFEIVYLLLDKKCVTAQELAEHFEVSTRTIYRDIETLSGAGIPIYTNKGKGGGIHLLEEFVLNKSLLSEQEQNDILLSLQSLNAVNFKDMNPVLSKISRLFNKQGVQWMDVDFTRWGHFSKEKDTFNCFKTAILEKRVVWFSYYSSYGEKTTRWVEPVKLIFKGQGWYVYGYCRNKEDFRFFKLSRVDDLQLQEEIFERDIPKEIWTEPKHYVHETVSLVLKATEKLAFRLYDEFDPTTVTKNGDGSFRVATEFPKEDWVIGYLLSFGPDLKVLEPASIRDALVATLQKNLNNYL